MKWNPSSNLLPLPAYLASFSSMTLITSWYVIHLFTCDLAQPTVEFKLPEIRDFALLSISLHLEVCLKYSRYAINIFLIKYLLNEYTLCLHLEKKQSILFLKKESNKSTDSRKTNIISRKNFNSNGKRREIIILENGHYCNWKHYSFEHLCGQGKKGKGKAMVIKEDCFF